MGLPGILPAMALLIFPMAFLCSPLREGILATAMPVPGLPKLNVPLQATFPGTASLRPIPPPWGIFHLIAFKGTWLSLL